MSSGAAGDVMLTWSSVIMMTNTGLLIAAMVLPQTLANSLPLLIKQKQRPGAPEFYFLCTCSIQNKHFWDGTGVLSFQQNIQTFRFSLLSFLSNMNLQLIIK
jgi:hypothetical protein